MSPPARPAFPPLDGSVAVLPGFVDFHDQHNPDREWARLAHDAPDAPYTPVTFREYADATHRVAHAFRPDGTRAQGELVAVLIHCDALLYLAVIPGLVRAGFVPFPMSPKNSAPAIVSMLEKTACHRLVSQPAFDPLVAAVQADLAQRHHALAVDELPSLARIFPQFGGDAGAAVARFPPPEKPHDKYDIVLYLHSSGSTGFPKPIPQRQCAILQWSSSSVVADAREHGIVWGSHALPTFHTMAIHMQLYAPLVTGYAVGLYAPRAPAAPVVPTPANLLAACRASRVNGIPAVPAIVEAWAQDADTVAYLRTLAILMFAGGPLSETNGDRLTRAGVTLFAVYGGTEYGVYTRIFDVGAHGKTADDWAWMTFPADRVRCRWDPQGDGTYELQYLTCATHDPAVENLPDTRGYATSDLFVPHPTKPGLWKVAGRKDDVLVLGTGEKVVPLQQEGILTATPEVAGALMFGRGRTQCGLLVEPRPEHAVDPRDPDALVAFRNRIWPAVEEANRIAPSFARIFKEMIIATDPARPLPRAAKGTIVRPQAVSLYAEDIEKLYTVVEESADAKGVAPPDAWDADTLEAWLAQLAASVNNDHAVEPTRDVFDQGFDSLHATFLRNRIAGALRAHPAAARVPQSFVYDHPTLRELARALAALVAQGAAAAGPEDAGAAVQRMLDAYARHLPVPRGGPRPVDEGPTVLLTGSTGNLGAHVLAALLADARVRRVYTLNRASAALPVAARQAAAFAARGLPATLLADARLTQLACDVTAAGFGLPAAQFDALKTDVTHVVHNAWRVDFNLALPSFEQHVAGVRRVVDWAAAQAHPPRVLFTSSVAAVARWDPARGRVPDAVQTDVGVAGANGYGASKFVAETLLDRAADAGLETTSLRIGQTCGPAATGAWGTAEWVPIIVKSGVALGSLPDLAGPVSWIPLDAVAAAVRALVAQPTPLPRLLNVVHPRPTPWHALLAAVAAHLAPAPPPLVPYAQWLAAVEAADPADPARVPALKILPFLRGVAAAAEGAEAGGLPAFETGTLEALPGVAGLEPLGARHAEAWVRYWRAQGFVE